ncbi:MAG: hydrogenase nickel incorporation protein HypB [Chloroflexi bacterium]|nr:hydrogenase nickel incorporation protein HypB [Chloroflexota bacterium]
MSTRSIPVIERIMGANDSLAQANRALLDAHRVHAVNLMAAPGAGKTTFIIAIANALRGRRRVAVLEGDVASDIDAARVRAAGIPATQVNTGGACHLDAPLVRAGLERLDLDAADLLFIENVGNLVCPVGFALGEHTRVALASIPEGDDKPLKYPSIYSAVDALVITKVDLRPYLPFDMPEFRRLVRSLNPEIRLFEVSAVTGEGLEELVAWLAELSATP